MAIYLNRAEDWTNNTLISRNYPPSFSHKLRSQHGGIKPPELCLELIYAYGRHAKSILDPFAGVGSSLVASSLLDIKATGIELNPLWKTIYLQVCEENNVLKQNFITGDSKKELKVFSKDSFDFVLTDIPYFSMDKLKKTRGKYSRAGQKSKDKLKTNLSNFNNQPFPTKEEWLKLLKDVFIEVYRIIKVNSYVLIFIGNMYRNIQEPNNKNKIGKYLMLSAEVAELLSKIGFNIIDELIWMDTSKKLGVYGYPYSWIPSLVDQRILVLQKIGQEFLDIEK